MQFAAAAPAVLLILFFIFNPHFVTGSPSVARSTIMIAIICAASAILTLAICARMVENRTLDELRREGTFQKFRFKPGTAIAFIAVGALGPALLSWIGKGWFINFLCFVLSIAPLIAVWFGAQIFERLGLDGKPEKKQAKDITSHRGKRRKRLRKLIEEKEGPLPPDWLTELLDNLPEEALAASAPMLLHQTEMSQLSGRNDLAPIFGGVVPTDDQVRAFERFCDAHSALVRGRSEQSDASADPFGGATADLLIHGDPGCGKTSTLLACATYAAFVRGQRVLFIVPDELKQRVIVERVESFLRKLGLQHYVSAGVVGEAAVERWVKGHAPLPQLLIATLPAAEAYIYGNVERSGDPFARLQRLVHLPEVIVVDELLDFDAAQRSHLPFVIDKQRLLLASEFMPLQVVVSTPSLAEIGREILGKRFFTLKRYRPNHVLELRPRPSGRAWRVDVAAPDVPAAVEALAAECLRQGLDVVVYRKGIDDAERRKQEKRLTHAATSSQKANEDDEEAQETPQVSVISDLDRPPKDAVKVDAIFYQVAIHQDVCLALRLHLGKDETVIFSVRPQGESREVVDGIVPVVADRAAESLLVAHLRSVLRFMHTHTPAPADTWQQFGIDQRRVAPASARLGEADTRVEVDTWTDPDGQLRIGTQVSLVARRELPEPVQTHRLPIATWAVCASRSRDQLFVARLGAAGQGDTSTSIALPTARRAQWVTDAGQDFGAIGEVDLAHVNELRLVYRDTAFAPRTIEQDGGGNIRLMTDVWRGGGSDRYMPVLDLRFDLPSDLRTFGQWGGLADKLRWFEGDTPDPDGVRVDARIMGLMSDHAEASDLRPVSFSFDAAYAAMIFEPTMLDRDDQGHTVGPKLAGPWATGDDARFWPELTGAFNYALQMRVPGVTYFSRVLAYQLTGDAAQLGKAIVWFVEPTTGGRTASRVFSRVLGHPDERRRMIQSVGWFLWQLQQVVKADGSPSRHLRRFARVAYTGDNRGDRVDDALALVDSVLGPMQKG